MARSPATLAGSSASIPWRWPLLVVAAWAALVVISTLLSSRTGIESTSCLFRNLTGQPCVTCGGTRATIYLARGGFAQALRMNPMVTFAWFIVPVAGVRWHMRRRRGLPGFDAQTEKRLWIAAAFMLAANWAYLLIVRPF